MQDKDFERQLSSIISSRRVIRVGVAFIMIFFVGFGYWATTAPLSNAVVARGSIIKEGRSQKISHAHGGVVKEILVEEGERVTRGQLLALIEDPEKTTLVAQIATRLEAIALTEERLTSELSRNDFSTSAQRFSKYPPQMLKDQQDLFSARQKTRKDRANEIRFRRHALEQELMGKKRELEALEVQRGLLKEQVDVQMHLFTKGAASKASLRVAKRQASQLETRYQTTLTQLASLPSRISELTSQLDRQEADFISSVLEELANLRSEKAILEKRLSASTILAARKEVSAPASGIVDKAYINTMGTAVSAYVPLFDIVPEDAPMLVEVEINPSDIEDVTIGQSARLSLTAYDQTEIPLMAGEVQFISPDARRPDRLEKPKYIVRLTLNEPEHADMPKLMPGMPIEVFLQKPARTFLQILLDPLIKSIQRSFKI